MSKSKKHLNTQHEAPAAARDIGRRKKFHPKDLCNLKPDNVRQETFLRLFYENTPMITATGPAGTGKTFLALYAALSLVLDDSTVYDKVLIIRSAVETRGQGFIPGEIDDKNAPYEIPYAQTVNKIMPQFNDGYRHLKSLGYVEFITTGYLRGQSLDNTIVICDETQNCDYAELSTIITRIGEDSRIILLGDSKQCDLQRKREKSGFEKLCAVMQKMPASFVGHVEYRLDDIVRSGLVREFLIADYHTA